MRATDPEYDPRKPPAPDPLRLGQLRGRRQPRVQRVALGDRRGALGELAAPGLEVVRAVSAAAMILPTSTKSSTCSPRVASAGVPIRSPDDTAGGRGSNGTALRLTVIPTACQAILGLLAVEL